MNIDILKKIIKNGTQAPSGDNSQPWKFVINKKNELYLYNLAEKDNPILNVHQGGSYLSHGAVILNIRIAADNFGYETVVSYFPDENKVDLVASFSFIKNDKRKYNPDLFDSIYKRSTNRRHYKKELNSNIVNQVFNNIQENDIKINIFTDQEDKDQVASFISKSEEIILKTKELHELLFKDIMWTKKQELKEKHGLYVKTLEFNPVQSFVFWLCRKWKNILFLNKKINFYKIVGKQNTDIYKSSGLIGFISIPSTQKENYIKAGELLQYIWLKSTSLGLGFQLITGLFFLNERIKVFGNKPISKPDSVVIMKNYEKLKKKLGILDDDIVVTSFRIGKSKNPRARSSRLDPLIVLE